LSTHVMHRWIADHLKAAAVTSVVTAGGLWAVYVSLRHWPEAWWLVSAGVFTVAMVGAARVAPVVLLPLVTQVRPLRRPTLSERLVRLAERAGAPVLGVYEWAISGHTRTANAALAGVGRSRRILLSDTLLEACSDEEIEVVVAHELSHQVHHDLWATMLLQTATLGAGFAVAARVLDVATPWLGLRGQADVAGAPVLLLVAGCWSFLIRPLGNALSRAQERRADRFALTLTRNPGGAADAREVLRVYKTDLAAAEGDIYKPIYLVSLTREVRSDGFDLYAIPALEPASPEDVAEVKRALAGAQGFSVLARRDSRGTLQDLITTLP